MAQSTDTVDLNFCANDRELLLKLATRVREIASQPVMEERRKLWFKHNSLKSERLMILVFPEGSWKEIIPEESLQCKNSVARQWENKLRQNIFYDEHIKDDNVIEPWFNIGWSVDYDNYGVEAVYHHGDNRGSFTWDPPIKNLKGDLKKLRFRKPKVDRELTFAKKALAESIFGDVLPVRIRGTHWWTCGLTIRAIELVGLEEFMLYMYDDPDGLHNLMKFLSDEMVNFTGWFEKEGLLSDMNENDYTGSGGVGYTDELPLPDRKPGANVRLKDTWGFAESQETVGVGPEMFAEFIWPYQVPLLKQFGLNCYGCCEGVDARLKYILQDKNMRRISVSPWANQEKCAEILGKKYIYSRKPNPALIGLTFNEPEVRQDLETTARIAKNCNLEIILKDLHTVQKDPSRISRWVEMARKITL